MPLHQKDYDVSNETWATQESGRDKHLLRMVDTGLANANKITVKMPEMNGGTVISILPYPAEFDEDGKARGSSIVPDRIANSQDDPRRYNRWMFKAADRGVVRFGQKWISVLFDNPDPSTGWDFDQDHPIQLIANTVDYAVYKKLDVQTPYGSSESDNWYSLVKETQGEGGRGKTYPIIKRPEVLYIVYALVYHSGKDSYYESTGVPFGADPRDPLVAFVMLKSTAQTFMDAIDTPLRNDKPTEGLLHPNVTGCRFVHYYNLQQPCTTVRSDVGFVAGDDGLGGFRRGPSIKVGEKSKAGFGYGVKVTETYDGTQNARRLDRNAVGKLSCNKVIRWDKALRGHTPEECAELVQSMAGLPLSVLSHCWQKHPEYINSVTRGLMAARKTSFPDRPSQTQTQERQQPEQRRTEFDLFGGSPQVQDYGRPEAPAFGGGRTFDPPADVPTRSDDDPQDGGNPGAGDDQNDVYDPVQVKSANDRLRAALNSQAAGTPPPSIPLPPQFNPRKPGN